MDLPGCVLIRLVGSYLSAVYEAAGVADADEWWATAIISHFAQLRCDMHDTVCIGVAQVVEQSSGNPRVSGLFAGSSWLLV